MAAGITSSDFPVDSKPKCLFHYEGEVILERLVCVLKEVGVDEIVLVGGYKIGLIEQFNEDRKLGLKVAHNPKAALAHRKLSESWWSAWEETVRVGLEGLDDDVLLTFGDAILNEEGVRRVLDHPKRCISLYSHGFQMFKIPGELIPKLRVCLREVGFNSRVLGVIHNINDFCLINDGFKLCIGTMMEELSNTLIGVVDDSATMCDVDSFYQTDEGKLAS